MTLKGRYLLEMQETESASGAAQVLARRLAGDWQLQSAAKKRARGSGEDRWWSAAAGLLLVIVFVFYSLYWNIPALIALIALVGLLLWELFRTLSPVSYTHLFRGRFARAFAMAWVSAWGPQARISGAFNS